MNLYEKIKESSLLKESDIKVGDVFKNKQGATIKVVEPTKAGEPQFNFLDKDGKPTDCRGTNSYESLAKILKVNGYEKVNESTLTEGTNLRGSVYTEIVRSIDDTCSEEMDEEEIRKFLQDLMGYIRETAESYNVIVESDKLNESYMDAKNKIEDAIREALKDDFFKDEDSVGEFLDGIIQFIRSFGAEYNVPITEASKLKESDELNLNIVMNQAVKELMPVLKEFKFDGVTFNYKLKDDASDDLVNEAFKLASDKVKAEGCTLTRNTDTIEIK